MDVKCQGNQESSRKEKKRVKKIKKEVNGDEEVEDGKNIMKEGEKIYNITMKEEVLGTCHRFSANSVNLLPY